MRKLISLTIVLFVLSSIGIGIAFAYGHLKPTPKSLAAMHLTECALPCWIGIVPGKTTLAEALQRVNEVFGKLPGYKISASVVSIAIENKELNFQGNIVTDPVSQPDKVSIIVLRAENLSVGQLLEFSSHPTNVSPWPLYAFYIALLNTNYNNGVSVDMTFKEVNLNTLSDGLLIAGPSEFARLWVERYESPTWHGFGKYPLIALEGEMNEN